MVATTPIARSKTAALARVLDVVPRGYERYTCGSIAAGKALDLAEKFHRLYGIGASPAQRITRRKAGAANAVLVLYWPEDVAIVTWCLLATHGTGMERENLHAATDKPRMQFLGYELVRHTARDKTAWTWKRTDAEMCDLYNLLTEQCTKHHFGYVAETLERIAAQPGFHGVRVQSWALCQFARANGHDGETPYLFFLQKTSHGDRHQLRGVS